MQIKSNHLQRRCNHSPQLDNRWVKSQLDKQPDQFVQDQQIIQFNPVITDRNAVNHNFKITQTLSQSNKTYEHHQHTLSENCHSQSPHLSNLQTQQIINRCQSPNLLENIETSYYKKKSQLNQQIHHRLIEQPDSGQLILQSIQKTPKPQNNLCQSQIQQGFLIQTSTVRRTWAKDKKVGFVKADRVFEKLNRLWDMDARADVGLQYCNINGRELKKKQKDILDIQKMKAFKDYHHRKTNQAQSSQKSMHNKIASSNKLFACKKPYLKQLKNCPGQKMIDLEETSQTNDIVLGNTAQELNRDSLNERNGSNIVDERNSSNIDCSSKGNNRLKKKQNYGLVDLDCAGNNVWSGIESAKEMRRKKNKGYLESIMKNHPAIVAQQPMNIFQPPQNKADAILTQNNPHNLGNRGCLSKQQLKQDSYPEKLTIQAQLAQSKLQSHSFVQNQRPVNQSIILLSLPIFQVSNAETKVPYAETENPQENKNPQGNKNKRNNHSQDPQPTGNQNPQPINNKESIMQVHQPISQQIQDPFHFIADKPLEQVQSRVGQGFLMNILLDPDPDSVEQLSSFMPSKRKHIRKHKRQPYLSSENNKKASSMSKHKKINANQNQSSNYSQQCAQKQHKKSKQKKKYKQSSKNIDKHKQLKKNKKKSNTKSNKKSTKHNQSISLPSKDQNPQIQILELSDQNQQNINQNSLQPHSSKACQSFQKSQDENIKHQILIQGNDLTHYQDQPSTQPKQTIHDLIQIQLQTPLSNHSNSLIIQHQQKQNQQSNQSKQNPNKTKRISKKHQKISQKSQPKSIKDEKHQPKRQKIIKSKLKSKRQNNDQENVEQKDKVNDKVKKKLKKKDRKKRKSKNKIIGSQIEIISDNQQEKEAVQIVNNKQKQTVDINGTINEKPEEQINILHDQKAIKPKKQKRKKKEENELWRITVNEGDENEEGKIFVQTEITERQAKSKNIVNFKWDDDIYRKEMGQDQKVNWIYEESHETPSNLNQKQNDDEQINQTKQVNILSEGRAKEGVNKMGQVEKKMLGMIEIESGNSSVQIFSQSQNKSVFSIDGFSIPEVNNQMANNSQNHIKVIYYDSEDPAFNFSSINLDPQVDQVNQGILPKMDHSEGMRFIEIIEQK